MSIKWKYLSYRYQVSNDMYNWPQILSTTNELGPIFHMDCLENITQAFKYEPQSSHLNKKQYYIVQLNMKEIKIITCFSCLMN